MTKGEKRGSGDMLTAPPWGTQERGARGLQVGPQADRSDNRKAPSAASNKVGTQGRRGAKQGQEGRNGGRRKNVGAVTSGVRGNKRGREASRVNPESHRVGEREGDRTASGVAENPGRGSHGVVREGVPTPLGGRGTP